MRDDSGLAAPLLRIVSDRTPDEFGPSAVEEHIVPLVRVMQHVQGGKQPLERVARIRRLSSAGFRCPECIGHVWRAATKYCLVEQRALPSCDSALSRCRPS